MIVKNKKNNANYVNYKVGGFAKKALVPAGMQVNITDLKEETQILNVRDFNLGFFEIVKEVQVVEKTQAKEETPKKSSKKATAKKTTKKKTEDTLDKVKKEVKNYTDNKE